MAAALGVALVLTLPTASVSADSSDWNLHLDPAFATPLSGLLAPRNDAIVGAGFTTWGGLDWQFSAPFALEFSFGIGHMEEISGNPELDNATFLQGAVGFRLRLADDQAGYATERGGNALGNFFLTTHVGAMAWHFAELSLDVSLGYEWSIADPISAGIFARSVFGFFGDQLKAPDVDVIMTIGVALSFEVHVGAIPAGRYGIEDVHIEGLEALDDAALAACLGTRERPTFGFDFGASSTPSCGSPPFDGDRVRLEFFAWPWTDWPVFNAGVFERDIERVERWLRARGYYDGRVVSTHIEPEEARTEGMMPSEGVEHCVATADHGCPVRLSIRVEEGEPVRVARTSIRFDHTVSDALRDALRDRLELHASEPFDEALFERTKDEMRRELAERGYPDARVDGDVKINPARHEAFLLFQIRTGMPGVYGQICVTGYGELPPDTILAATYLEPGQDFDIARIEEAQRAIFALGTLSSVEIRHRVTRPQTVEESPAEQLAAELQSGEVQDGGGLDDEEQDGEVRSDGLQSGESESAEVRADAVESDGGEGASPAEQLADGTPPPTAAENANPGGSANAALLNRILGDREEQEAENPPFCTSRLGDLPSGHQAVDLEIAVEPGRLERLGFGIGIQAGDTITFGNTFTANNLNAQNLTQWDVHLLAIVEWRNLFNRMLRLRIEERPRLIFNSSFPGIVSSTGVGPSLGNEISVTGRWPAFLEPRTSLFAGISHEYGPIALYNFVRHELDGRIGVERTFLDGRLYLSGSIRGNLFLPDQEQNLRVNSQRESTRALILEQQVSLDLRDDPRNPSNGAYFGIDLQECGFGGLSSWDYFRVTAEARGYLELGLGIVLAGRFAMGSMFVLWTELNQDNIYDLARLGPVAEQLQGGGSVSNRGVPAGFLGDVRRRPVQARPIPGVETPDYPAITVSGGIRRWEGSLELRVPVTTDLGLVLFADVGNVTREEDFRLDVPNLAVGMGIRYRTLVGPIRFDFALRPINQELGTADLPACTGGSIQTECRPQHYLFDSVAGAIHLTIGEAF